MVAGKRSATAVEQNLCGGGIPVEDLFLLHEGSVQWQNDLGLYSSLVLVMNIGMCGW